MTQNLEIFASILVYRAFTKLFLFYFFFILKCRRELSDSRKVDVQIYF